MSSQLITIADAVVTALNAASFSQTITAVRSYVATRDLKDSDSLTVDVMPVEMTKEIQTRTTDIESYTVRVIVQKRTDTDANATLDALSLFVEEISDLLLATRLASPTVMCLAVEVIPFSLVDIRERNQFAASVTATYEQVR
jgi:hypothetical protein